MGSARTLSRDSPPRTARRSNLRVLCVEAFQNPEERERKGGRSGPVLRGSDAFRLAASERYPGAVSGGTARSGDAQL